MAKRNMPAAEVDIDTSLVRRLLVAQKPDLAELPIDPIAFGWDNVSFLLGTDLVARMPRRALAAGLIAHEVRWLPELAPDLPLPIPVPVFLGEPGDGYPWQWLIAPLLPGEPSSTAGHVDYEECARQLGEFLAALHRPAPTDAPENPFRGGSLTDRDDATRERLARLTGHVDVARLERLWDELSTAPEHEGSPTWLHGDLHPDNLLVRDGKLSGVIDFGDITKGDPATDLAIAWSFLPSRDRAGFWRSYGEPAEAVKSRARGWALSLGTAYLAHSADNPTMAAIGERALAAVLREG